MTASSIAFSFQAQELPKQLSNTSAGATGYWKIELFGSDRPQPWYLSLVQGRLVFSGSDPLCWTGLLEVLQRYVPRLRTRAAQQLLLQLEQETTPEQQERLGSMLNKLKQSLNLSYEEVTKALRLSIMADCDAYLFGYAGKAEFIADYSMIARTPVTGVEFEQVLTKAIARQSQWRSVQQLVQSLKQVPMLNAQALERSQLTSEQKQQLQRLTNLGKPLGELAEDLGKDPLELVKTFASLIQSGVVRLRTPGQTDQPTALAAEVAIVDDSPVFLKQFHDLLGGWGYRVRACHTATTAAQELATAHPKMIFLDINMPELNGFELIKQIRRQPQLAGIPLVLLTGERSVTNQWRAQWASCKFLAKPRALEEIPTFKTELQVLLREAITANPS